MGQLLLQDEGELICMSVHAAVAMRSVAAAKINRNSPVSHELVPEQCD